MYITSKYLEMMKQSLKEYKELLVRLAALEPKPDLTEIPWRNLKTLEEGLKRLLQLVRLQPTPHYYLAMREALEFVRQSSYPEQIDIMFLLPEIAHEEQSLTEVRNLFSTLHTETIAIIEAIKPYTGP